MEPDQWVRLPFYVKQVPVPWFTFFLKRETNKKKKPVGTSLDSDILMKMTKKLRKVWKIKEKCLSLQHERNLFRVRAPVGPASKAIKAEFLFVM